MLVLDASLAIAWGFEDESDSLARAVLCRFDGNTAVVPSIWPFEVANAVLVGERRQRWSQGPIGGLFRTAGHVADRNRLRC